ncbi:hypothetical protein ACPA9J_16530 [Pseudomonas aeruginosa]
MEAFGATRRAGARLRSRAMQETQRPHGHDERLSLMGTPEATL